ncbi:MAG TPA: SUF system NifU family Fe-S cluster assembly protein [Candidatus Krumholzibacteria bacterium]|nr:SUF system NifU family Fe-S cluster assembly protein [Candidatus Krumholzibacteria bacterium]
MSEMRELYQEMILDHHRHPRNSGKLPGANRSAEGFNPLCGDRVTVYALVEGDRIQDISFEGSGCAICIASCSLMTEALRGRTVAEAEALFGRFHDLLTNDAAVLDEAAMGKLAVFEGVREFPVRVKCATLPWHAFRAAMQQTVNQSVSTE